MSIKLKNNNLKLEREGMQVIKDESRVCVEMNKETENLDLDNFGGRACCRVCTKVIGSIMN